jgi:hypothetical protein
MATAAAALYYITWAKRAYFYSMFWPLGRVMVPGHEPMMYWALSNPSSSPELLKKKLLAGPLEPATGR